MSIRETKLPVAHVRHHQVVRGYTEYLYYQVSNSLTIGLRLILKSYDYFTRYPFTIFQNTYLDEA